MAACWAAVGATPGGGGGIEGGLFAEKRAPASNWPVTGPTWGVGAGAG